MSNLLFSPHRREFLIQAFSVSVVLTGLQALTSGCGGSTGSGQSTTLSGNCQANGTTTNISSNHGHSLTVSASDVVSGAAKTYSVQGSAGHDHSVTVTASDFTSLQAGQTVTLTATTEAGHSHTVTVGCA